MGKFVVAVDVGTGSARAGLFDRRGSLIARASHPILTHRESASRAAHSSGDIWQAVAKATRGAVAAAGAAPEAIDAIAFDATCSLTVLAADGSPVGIAETGGGEWDTIAWFDHRALAEAERLTATGQPALRHTGEIVSPEMQLPKLMWLREKMPSAWKAAGLIFDLADFLTWRATGSARRGLSTLATKWNYLAHDQQGWSPEFLAAAGLSDLRQKTGIVGQPVAPGRPVGRLSPQAAAELGLSAEIAVSSGMVDAFAGLLSLLGAEPDRPDTAALVGGTSSCVMRMTQSPQFIRSFWGPYRDVTLEGLWVTEGGQSATGALLDLIVQTHGAGGAADISSHQRVLARIEELLARDGEDFAGELHILPDHHGNRSPFGDATARGAVQGLSLDPSFDGLCKIYYRAMVSLALGIRQILDLMEPSEQPLTRLEFGGGHTNNPVLSRLYADVTGRDIVISAGDETMLHGSAIAAAASAGWYASLATACQGMKRNGITLRPDISRRNRFDRDYRVFLKMQEHRREIANLR